MTVEFLGVAPWVIVAACVTWIGSGMKHRLAARKIELTHHENVEAHKDGLTFQLLNSAREEVTAARGEMEELRDEVRTLRALEKHFFHFQQALDHLEALLTAVDQTARTSAERNARAFLNRMRRLAEAKGTIANETQTAESTIRNAEDKIGKAGEP